MPVVEYSIVCHGTYLNSISHSQNVYATLVLDTQWNEKYILQVSIRIFLCQNAAKHLSKHNRFIRWPHIIIGQQLRRWVSTDWDHFSWLINLLMVLTPLPIIKLSHELVFNIFCLIKGTESQYQWILYHHHHHQNTSLVEKWMFVHSLDSFSSTHWLTQKCPPITT